MGCCSSGSRKSGKPNKPNEPNEPNELNELNEPDKPDGGMKMKITKEEVRHVADLARLDLDDAAVDTFAGQLGTILEYVDTLNHVDTTGVRPTSHAISLTNAFREDVPTVHLEREKALANAPEKEDGSFLVPKIVG